MSKPLQQIKDELYTKLSYLGQEGISLEDALEAIEATYNTRTQEVRKEEQERIKREIMQQTMLNDGNDTFVKLGEALWVCDSIEDRKAFMTALSPEVKDDSKYLDNADAFERQGYVPEDDSK